MSHPDPAFGWTDADAIRRFVAARGFAHLLFVRDGAPRVAHAPLTVTAAGHVRFHLARRNPVDPIPDGTPALASIAGADGYVSPDWYGAPDQVPTWNYVAAEAEGSIHALDEAALIEQLDLLSAVHEARLAPKPAWTRARLAPARLAALLGAIRGYELRVTAWRGTRKLGQNKPPAQQAGAVAGMAASGAVVLAELMAAAR